MGRVFVTRHTPGRAVELLQAAGHEVTLWPGDGPPPPEELTRHLAHADAALTMLTDRVDEAVLAAAPHLRVVANMAVGYDNFDTAAGNLAGVWMTNTPGVLAETTADLAFGLMLAAARRIAESDRDTRESGWRPWTPTTWMGWDVHGATLGIVGLGEIGAAVARRARGFGMRLLAATRTAKPALEAELDVVRVPLDQLLRESDFVSLHTPLNADTRGLIGGRELRLMKPGAILVNTARGPVVDTAALVTALRERRIGGAALDVTDPEPLPPGHPLFGFPNVVITPHIASATHATRARIAEMAAENIMAVLAGRTPPNPVNRPASLRSS